MKVGDVVYLKSGSPPLTVVNADHAGEHTGSVTVSWNDGPEVKRGCFAVAQLTTEDPGPA